MVETDMEKSDAPDFFRLLRLGRQAKHEEQSAESENPDLLSLTVA
jgi:hypothetical protein